MNINSNIAFCYRTYFDIDYVDCNAFKKEWMNYWLRQLLIR